MNNLIKAAFGIWMNAWIQEWKNEWMSEWMNTLMNKKWMNGTKIGHKCLEREAVA